MEITKNSENNTTNPVDTSPPLLNKVELCTLCAQYVIAYTFQLDRF